MLAGALDLAAGMKDDYVATEHLLVALAGTESPAQKVLLDAGLSEAGLREGLGAVRGSRRVTSQDAESTYEALEKYSVDLTALAEEGGLDPVIGRDAEIRRVVQVLSRRTKNNPVLTASPAWARPPWSRAWPSAWSRATCPTRSRGAGCSASTWPRWCRCEVPR